MLRGEPFNFRTLKLPILSNPLNPLNHLNPLNILNLLNTLNPEGTLWTIGWI